MISRVRHQTGCLRRVRRRRGLLVWVFRWREIRPDGSRRPRKIVIGSAKDLPTERAAWEAVAKRQLNINLDLSENAGAPASFLQVVEHYRRKELERTDPDHGVAQSTKDSYESYLQKWIVPRWGVYSLERMASGIAVHVEDWLAQIKRSRGTRAKIRNIMSAVCSHAVRYGWMRNNPTTPSGRVRSGSARR